MFCLLSDDPGHGTDTSFVFLVISSLPCPVRSRMLDHHSAVTPAVAGSVDAKQTGLRQAIAAPHKLNVQSWHCTKGLRD
jgi:hypothetical protein